jgi:5-methylthioadenosine/S-adenosylhomocysteine deaminase
VTLDPTALREQSSAAAAGLASRAGTDRFAHREWRSLISSGRGGGARVPKP